MKVELVFEVIPYMNCKYCNYVWEAHIQTTQIDFDDFKELKLQKQTECPKCLKDTPVIREKDNF
tara:strand:- start:1545 stop:1736 length:192 start_codon:yes stop_codon:yes gene_type:complete